MTNERARTWADEIEQQPRVLDRHPRPAVPNAERARIPASQLPTTRSGIPLPRRIRGVPWCPECGMDEGHHWSGCTLAPAT